MLLSFREMSYMDEVKQLMVRSACCSQCGTKCHSGVQCCGIAEAFLNSVIHVMNAVVMLRHCCNEC